MKKMHQLNVGRARGSGIYIWLQEQICQLFEDGAILIQQSRGRKQGHQWLLAQVKARGADDLLEAYRVRCNIDAVARSWRQKRFELACLEKLQEEGDTSPVVEKRITKLRKTLKRREE